MRESEREGGETGEVRLTCCESGTDERADTWMSPIQVPITALSSRKCEEYRMRQ